MKTLTCLLMRDVCLVAVLVSLILGRATSDEYSKLLTNLNGSRSGVSEASLSTNFKLFTSSFGAYIQEIARKQLDLKAIQSTVESHRYEINDPIEDAEQKLVQITLSIAENLNSVGEILRKNQVLISGAASTSVSPSLADPVISCCWRNASTQLGDVDISTDNGCHLSFIHTDSELSGTDVCVPFVQGARRWSVDVGGLAKRQFYISSQEGFQCEFPGYTGLPAVTTQRMCEDRLHTRHRAEYMRATRSTPKTLVIVLDVGQSLSSTQLDNAKMVAKAAIASLYDSDQVAVLAVESDSEAVRVIELSCCSRRLSAAIPENKQALTHFLTQLKLTVTSSRITNHTASFVEAFTLLGQYDSSVHSPSEIARGDISVVYMSEGVMESSKLAEQTLAVIAQGNGVLKGRVVINTLTLADKTTVVTSANEFMKDLSAQDYTKYGVIYNGPPTTPGLAAVIQSDQDIQDVIDSLFPSDQPSALNTATPILTGPSKDLLDGKSVLSLSLPCVSTDHQPQTLIGVVGIDMDRAHILRDSMKFSGTSGTYSFVIDTQGKAVDHPLLDKKGGVEPVDRPDVSLLEEVPGFSETVKPALISSMNGSQAVSLCSDPAGSTQCELGGAAGTRLHYLWRRVEGYPLIAVLRLTVNEHSHIYQPTFDNQVSALVSHRLDLLPASALCLHLKEIGTLSEGTVYLSPKAYEGEPFPETQRSVQTYMSYLSDETGMITNVGFTAHVKAAVAMLSSNTYSWAREKDGHRVAWTADGSSLLKNKLTPGGRIIQDMVIRKYVASPVGVLEMYPGTLRRGAPEPSESPWYRAALRFPDRLTFTKPYIDWGGAGYIISVAKAFYKGSDGSVSDKSLEAVVGMDIPVSSLYTLLLESMPLCKEVGISCFLMEESGYVLAHALLRLSANPESSEQGHITQLRDEHGKQYSIVPELLKREELVEKKLCHDYSTATTKRYYEFNTSFSGVLSSNDKVDPPYTACPQYLLTVVPGTNLFLGLINTACRPDPSSVVFCPCSQYDRTCLNCDEVSAKMEAKLCECPCRCACECPFCASADGSSKSSNPDQRIPACPLVAEPKYKYDRPGNLEDSLPQCFRVVCSSRTTYSECSLSVGCSWCERLLNGSALFRPFCSPLQVCFGGTLTAPTPYGPPIQPPPGFISDGQEIPQRRLSERAAPVGAIVGGVVGFLIFLGVGLYCYRKQGDEDGEETGGEGAHSRGSEEFGPLMGEDQEGRELQRMGHGEGNGQVQLMAEGGRGAVPQIYENPLDVSPYRVVNVGYVRPRPPAPRSMTTTESSDRGYSTMSPHDDGGSSPNEEGDNSSSSCRETLFEESAIEGCSPYANGERDQGGLEEESSGLLSTSESRRRGKGPHEKLFSVTSSRRSGRDRSAGRRSIKISRNGHLRPPRSKIPDIITNEAVTDTFPGNDDRRGRNSCRSPLSQLRDPEDSCSTECLTASDSLAEETEEARRTDDGRGHAYQGHIHRAQGHRVVTYAQIHHLDGC